MKNSSPFKSPHKIFPKYQDFFKYARRAFSAASLDSSELKEFMEYMDNFKNYEKSGVPKNAGTDSADGFDLGRMRHLLQQLGNPQSKFKAFHIAGTKGKGSTATFLSSILRAEGYSVGCYTSPHIRTIRERITLGKTGEAVSIKELNSHFLKIKKDLDIVVELEKGHLSHFEVFTAFAFSLFAEAKVQFAVIEAGLGGARDATNVLTSSDLAVTIITNVGEEHLAALGGSLESIALAKSGIIKYGRPINEPGDSLALDKTFCDFEHEALGCFHGFGVESLSKHLVLGGTFLPHIKRMIIDRAMSLCSPVISVSDPGNKSMLKGLSRLSQMPRQLCDVVLRIKRDLGVSVELFDVKLRVLGSHQLQNAATATCAALCLRDQGEKGLNADFIEELEATKYHTSQKESKYGWALSDASIRTGLEDAFLLGRGQFLTSKEAEVLGLSGAAVLVDGAHTKGSAQALADVIKTTHPQASLVFVVAMANDKDHLGFARELISVGCLEAVVFTEVSIAGDKFRTASASLLKDSWIQASRDMGVDFLYCGTTKYEDQFTPSTQNRGRRPILFAEGSLEDSMSFGHRILRSESCGLIIFTGSLHIVSAVLGHLQG